MSGKSAAETQLAGAERDNKKHTERISVLQAGKDVLEGVVQQLCQLVEQQQRCCAAVMLTINFQEHVSFRCTAATMLV